ncbi:MAG: methyl-accepting chemotaxis protein [Rhodocyclaceae bacterium]|nr:methyl-accepting chemotaxis protein [Rhodocyclaceae bacterium]
MSNPVSSGMSLQARLTLLAALPCVMLVIVAAVGLFFLKHNDEDALEFIRGGADVHADAFDLYSVGLEMSVGLRNALLNPSEPAGREMWIEAAGEVPELIGHLRENVQYLDGTAGALDAIDEGFRVLIEQQKGVLEKIAQGDLSGARQALIASEVKTWAEVGERVHHQAHYLEKYGDEVKEELVEQGGEAFAIMVVLGLVALGATMGVAWLVSRSILNQLGADPSMLSDAAQRMASCDMTQPFHDVRTGSLLADFARMQREVAHSVMTIRKCAYEASEELATLKRRQGNLTEDTRAQAEAGNAIAAAVEEMTASISQVSQQVTDANAEMTNMSARMEDSSGKMEQTVEIVGRISQQMNESAEVMEKLDEHAKSISSIVSVIQDVAGQTNLLALNAAIEAARAGEQGRGFAVVADEVRKLAERTAQSAQEITEMIASVQETSSSAATQMRNGRDLVEQGVAYVEEMRTVLGEMSVGVEGVRQGTIIVNNALTEQTAASGEISNQVADSAHRSEDCERRSGQSLEQAETLVQITDRLRTAVDKFRVRE